MSFASGLFSFAGGLSTGLREEIDLSNKRKSDKAIADALAIKEQKEADEDARRFGITTDLEERKITVSETLADIKSKEQKQKEYEFRQTNKLALNKFDFEKEKWHDSYAQQLNEYNLKKSDLEAKLKLAKNKDEREETELSLKVLDQNWNQKQDEIQNEFQIDELDFKKYKVDVENDAEMRKALEEAQEGRVDFSKGLTFNKGSYEPKEQPAAFLSWANYNLSKEVIDGLTQEGKLALVTEFNIATERMVLNSKQTDGTFIDLAEDKYNNAFAMAQYLPGALNLKETIKKVELETEENKDADTVIVNAENSEDGKTKIVPVPIKYEELAELHGFESAEELTNSLDSLVTISKKKATSAMYEDNLNPFESRETLISSLNDKNIDLSVLKLSPYVDNIQEATYTDIGIATDYVELVEKAFEFGILTRDSNGHIQGESQLIDFIFMMQPKQEYATKSGVTIQTSSSSPDAYGLKETVNAKDAKAQNDSSKTAIATAIKLKNVLNDPSSDKIGLALNIAAKVYGITTQYEQLSALWGGTRNNFGNNLNTENISEAKLNEDVYDDILRVIPDNYSYKNLAQDIADVIKDAYGSHNIEPFMREIGRALKEGKLNEALPKFKTPYEAFSWIMNKREEGMDIEMEMLQKTKDIIQTQKDMEQEASPEGGPTTDRYGAVLEKLQMEHEALRKQFAAIMAEIDEYDQNY